VIQITAFLCAVGMLLYMAAFPQPATVDEALFLTFATLVFYGERIISHLEKEAKERNK
jgi:hypothetical protein